MIRHIVVLASGTHGQIRYTSLVIIGDRWLYVWIIPIAKQVVIGPLSPDWTQALERIAGPAWRPSVSICQHENLLVHRLELLHGPKEEKLARLVAATSRSVSPETEVRTHLVPMKDPWDFEEVYAALHDFARAVSLQSRGGRVSRPHHHGHPRRANLPVPADRIASLAGQAPAVVAAGPATPARPDRLLLDHRPGPVEVRSPRDPIPPGPQTSHSRSSSRASTRAMPSSTA